MPVDTSIIVRTLNEAKHLEKLLKGIHEQDYKDWEIILVDSGSTDGTLDIARRYDARIFHIPQAEFTYGRSLNLGCREAQGSYLVFASGHVWPITNNWLGNLVKPFQEPSVAMVYGRQRGTGASRLSEIRDLQMQFGSVSQILVDEPKGNNGNAAIRRDLWLEQPFDEALPALEDVDWARKIERKGHRVYYAADAGVYHLHEESLGQVYHRYLREAIASKRMFPHNKFTLSDMVKGLPYFIARDLLFAFRQKKPEKFIQVPGARFAQFLGIYRGHRHYRQRSREMTRQMEVPDTFQRVVVEGPGRDGLEICEMPELRPDEVLVRVAYAPVHPADVKLAEEGAASERDYAFYPMVPGHEFSGVVAGQGSAAPFKKGQHVAGQCVVGCGRCTACTEGDGLRCANGNETTANGSHGTYAQYLIRPARQLHKLPADLPLKHGALVAPVARCLEGLQSLAVQSGASACVLGAGLTGNLCAQILRARGLRVTVIDRDTRWLALLNKYDVDTLTEVGPLDKYDYVVETTGNQDVLQHLAEASPSSAKMLFLRLPCSETPRSLRDQVTSLSNATRSIGARHSRSWKDALGLIRAGAIGLEEHTALVEPLEAYRDAMASVGSQKVFSILLRVSEDLEAM